MKPALQADYIFPDHTALEVVGVSERLERGRPGGHLRDLNPWWLPFYNTTATADVLLAAVQAIGGDLVTALPYKDEVEYIQSSLVNLVTQDGYFNAPEINTFMAQFQQYGGWWDAQPRLDIPNWHPCAKPAIINDHGKFRRQRRFLLVSIHVTDPGGWQWGEQTLAARNARSDHHRDVEYLGGDQPGNRG